MTTGSGLFGDQGPDIPHLVEGKRGVAGEVDDLRDDIGSVLGGMAALTVEEFTNVDAAAAAALEAATATQAPVRTATLLQAGLDILAKHPRTITFTVAGGTPAHAPANAVITGQDDNGDVQTETVSLNQGGGLTTSVKTFKDTGLSIAYPAGDGTNATVSIGIGPILGLGKKLKSRAGAVAVLHEIEAGTPKAGDALAGTYADAATSPPNGSYSPGAAPNDTNDYAIFYEYDPTAP